MPIVNLLGLRLDIDVQNAQSTPSTQHANGYSELEWTLESGTDEIGETISRKGLDLIADKFLDDIERAIWAQIGR